MIVLTLIANTYILKSDMFPTGTKAKSDFMSEPLSITQKVKYYLFCVLPEMSYLLLITSSIQKRQIKP